MLRNFSRIAGLWRTVRNSFGAGPRGGIIRSSRARAPGVCSGTRRASRVAAIGAALPLLDLKHVQFVLNWRKRSVAATLRRRAPDDRSRLAHHRGPIMALLDLAGPPWASGRMGLIGAARSARSIPVTRPLQRHPTRRAAARRRASTGSRRRGSGDASRLRPLSCAASASPRSALERLSTPASRSSSRRLRSSPPP